MQKNAARIESAPRFLGIRRAIQSLARLGLQLQVFAQASQSLVAYALAGQLGLQIGPGAGSADAFGQALNQAFESAKLGGAAGENRQQLVGFSSPVGATMSWGRKFTVDWQNGPKTRPVGRVSPQGVTRRLQR